MDTQLSGTKEVKTKTRGCSELTTTVEIGLPQAPRELRDIDESFEFWVWKSVDDAVSFCHNPVSAVRLFDFNKDKRKTVDEECDVRAKLFVIFLTGELGDNVE